MHGRGSLRSGPAASGLDGAGRRDELAGLLLGFVGVAIFSLSLPATRRAAMELDATFVAFGRMAVAGLLGGSLMLLRRVKLPVRADLPALLAVAVGVVLGFPLFSTLAMRQVDASHGGVVVAILPMATAVAAALLGGERPSASFWLAAVGGAVLVLGFALWRSQGRIAAADLDLLLGCILCAAGYAAGGRLARRMPGIEVITWALVLSLPISLPVTLWRVPALDPGASAMAWLAFAYLALMSQFLGFYFWYGGLARGGIAKVGQVQLLQTFLTLAASAVLLGERVGPATWLVAAAVVALVWAARRAPVSPARALPAGRIERYGSGT